MVDMGLVYSGEAAVRAWRVLIFNWDQIQLPVLFLAVWPRAKHFTSLSLGILIWKMGIKIATGLLDALRKILYMKDPDTWQVLSGCELNVNLPFKHLINSGKRFLSYWGLILIETGMNSLAGREFGYPTPFVPLLVREWFACCLFLHSFLHSVITFWVPTFCQPLG